LSLYLFRNKSLKLDLSTLTPFSSTQVSNVAHIGISLAGSLLVMGSLWAVSYEPDAIPIGEYLGRFSGEYTGFRYSVAGVLLDYHAFHLIIIIMVLIVSRLLLNAKVSLFPQQIIRDGALRFSRFFKLSPSANGPTHGEMDLE
jgi:hypothetical protein